MTAITHLIPVSSGAAPPLLPYIYMEWYLIKHRDKFKINI